jgi:hypothetical protein
MMIMIRTPDFDADDRSLPPDCRQTVDRLQGVLDGEHPRTDLDTDSHPSSCPACRERIASAKLLLSVLSIPVEAPPLPCGLTDKIVAAILADRGAERRTHLSRRVFALAGGLAIAAGVFLVVWLRWFGSNHQNHWSQNPEVANTKPTNPATNSAPEPHTAPTPRPVRLGDEFSKAEHALLGSSKPITEPATVAPQVLVKLTDVLTSPGGPAPEFEPARMSLIELPEAARTGLQPVTATAQKAFARLMRDMGAVQASSKPN